MELTTITLQRDHGSNDTYADVTAVNGIARTVTDAFYAAPEGNDGHRITVLEASDREPCFKHAVAPYSSATHFAVIAFRNEYESRQFCVPCPTASSAARMARAMRSLFT